MLMKIPVARLNVEVDRIGCGNKSTTETGLSTWKMPANVLATSPGTGKTEPYSKSTKL